MLNALPSRAWHQAHVPSATVRLATHYLPLTTLLPTPVAVENPSTPTSNSPSPEATPIPTHATAPYTDATISPLRGTPAYYLDRLGGEHNLARLYLEAGLLYLEGSASSLLSSSYAGLSSLRTPTAMYGGFLSPLSGPDQGSAEIWNDDQAHARRFFNRARALHPGLDVPLLPASNPSSEPESGDTGSPVFGSETGSQPRLRTPPTNAQASGAGSGSGANEKPVRRRRRRDAAQVLDENENLAASVTSKSAVEDRLDGQEDNTWYLYLPGLVGAGTALLVVGFLSFSSWRKGQGT